MTTHNVLELVEHQRDRNLEEAERALHRVAQLEAALEDAHRHHLATIGALLDALSPFALAWDSIKPKHDGNEKAYQRRLSHVLGGFHSFNRRGGERYLLTGRHLRAAHEALHAVERPALEARLLQGVQALLALDDLHSPEFDDALATVQPLIGQAKGDVAAQAFIGKEGTWADASPDQRLALLGEYLEAEMGEIRALLGK